MPYSGMNFLHGGLYAFIIHIIVYFYFIPPTVTSEIKSFRGCSAGALFLMTKIGYDMGSLPEKFMPLITSKALLQSYLDMNWHHMNVVLKAWKYDRFLKSLDLNLPNEFKNITFKDVLDSTGIRYCIEVTKLEYVPPILVPTTFSTSKTPNDKLWDAASSSANPFCFYREKYGSWLCDGGYNYEIFGNKNNILHVTTNSKGANILADVIYVPKGFKHVDDIFTFLQNTYFFNDHGKLMTKQR
jgi:hypothetical protein